MWMIPVLLVVAFLAIRQINRYPIAIDELLSINNAGYLADSRPATIFANLETYSAQHVPAYFLIVGFARHFYGWNIPALRMLGVFFALLSLVWVYRLGKEHHSGYAGLIGALFVAGLTLYSFYYAQIRMYTMLASMAGFFLWSYLRLIDDHRPPRARNLAILSVSTLLFLSSHIFSITLFIAVAIYHVVVVAKNRTWVNISGAIIIGGLPLVLWLPVLLKGFRHTSSFEIVITRALTPPEIFYNLLIVYSNSLIPFLVGWVIVATYIAWKHQPRLRRFLGLSGLTVFIFVLIGTVTPIIPPDRMRYSFVVVIPLAVAFGIMVASLRYRFVVAVVLLGIWFGSDLWMRRAFDMADYLGGQFNIFDMPPIQDQVVLIEAATREDTLILTFSNHRDLTLPVGHGNTVEDFYFDSVNRKHYGVFLPLEIQKSDAEIEAGLASAIEGYEDIAMIIDSRHQPNERILSLYSGVLERDYNTCNGEKLGNRLTITYYALMPCQP